MKLTLAPVSLDFRLWSVSETPYGEMASFEHLYESKCVSPSRKSHDLKLTALAINVHNTLRTCPPRSCQDKPEVGVREPRAVLLESAVVLWNALGTCCGETRRLRSETEPIWMMSVPVLFQLSAVKMGQLSLIILALTHEIGLSLLDSNQFVS